MHEVVCGMDDSEVASEKLQVPMLQMMSGDIVAIEEFLESWAISGPCELITEEEMWEFFDGPDSSFSFSCTGMLVCFRGILKSVGEEADGAETKVWKGVFEQAMFALFFCIFGFKGFLIIVVGLEENCSHPVNAPIGLEAKSTTEIWSFEDWAVQCLLFEGL